ncbi:MAG: type 2 isopentenyl-diphosphate Delta-isomerase [Pelolinea sp.]|nr:type 2 isopentenyl-diphosphate Delta-isomerase [Pelolinea sp.]
MKSNLSIHSRKDDHLIINSQKDVISSNTTGLEKFRLIHNALPEINLLDVDPSVKIFGKKLSLPLMISSMTGGTKKASEINQILAHSAQKYDIAMGVGSQRIGIENKRSMETFKVRKFAPDILLFSNIGAIQLNYGFTIDDCKKTVDAINSDALILHLNPLQEALMGNGNTNFSGILKKIEMVCKNLEVPVVVKEVGWGISSQVAKSLIDAGVQAIDVAGAGGTSWSEVEKYRITNPSGKRIAEGYRDWGISTSEAIINIRKEQRDTLIFASGGLQDGVDVIKSIALGANLGGVARKFLIAAMNSQEELDETIEEFSKQIQITMFAIGVKEIDAISTANIRRIE